MNEWTLHWNSSAGERYGGAMIAKADRIVKQSGLSVIEEFGGSVLGAEWADPTAADNGYVVESDDELAVKRLASEISKAVGHEVRVSQYTDA